MKEKLWNDAQILFAIVVGLGLAWLITPSGGIDPQCFIYTCIKVK